MGEKHTPGEWRVAPDMRIDRVGDRYAEDGYREYLAGWNIISDEGEIVGCEGIIPGPHAEADAHLMAASKDLLAALRAMRQRWDLYTGGIGGAGHTDDRLMQMADAAIAGGGR